MKDDILGSLDMICSVLRHPVCDVNLISRSLPSRFRAVAFDTTPVSRTFLCISCESSPPRSVVFFRGTTDDRIEARLVCEGADELSTLYELMRTDDPELEEICMAGMSQLVNPVFNFGSGLLTGMTIIVADKSTHNERIVGVVFGFPFGIRLGLHLYDDYRLSICFNEVCDTIVSQARKNGRLTILERPLGLADKPRYSEIDWFDWLKWDDSRPK